jgi:hypothetical protein
VISSIVDSIPIDFDKLWDILVLVLFTIGLGLSGTKTKKASSGARNLLGASYWNLPEIQCDNQPQTVEVRLGWLPLGNDRCLS